MREVWTYRAGQGEAPGLGVSRKERGKNTGRGLEVAVHPQMFLSCHSGEGLQDGHLQDGPSCSRRGAGSLSHAKKTMHVAFPSPEGDMFWK
jgi:hypothetical protein